MGSTDFWLVVSTQISSAMRYNHQHPRCTSVQLVSVVPLDLVIEMSVIRFHFVI